MYWASDVRRRRSAARSASASDEYRYCEGGRKLAGQECRIEVGAARAFARAGSHCGDPGSFHRVESEAHQVRSREARTLGEIGALLARLQLPEVDVRLPGELARAAVAAWERDDLDDSPGRETPEQRLKRHRAGSLALIGLAIKERGRWQEDEVVVALNAGIVGEAVDAADDLPAA
jgi:hypothetical protein